MDEKALGIVVGILIHLATAGVGGAIATGAIWFKSRGPKALARALAVGYYYNFVEVICTAAKESRLNVDGETFKIDNIRFKFFFPKALSSICNNKAMEVAELRTKNGDSAGRKFLYSIERDSEPVLVIHDFVRTYYIIYVYATNDLHLTENSKKWHDVEERALKAFEERLLDLMAKDGMFGLEKVALTFVERTVRTCKKVILNTSSSVGQILSGFKKKLLHILGRGNRKTNDHVILISVDECGQLSYYGDTERS